MGKTQISAGDIFGRLTVINRVENSNGNPGYNRPRWLCKCICGAEKEICGGSLSSGATKSCGCAKNINGRKRKDKNFKPKYKTSEYYIWDGIKKRCLRLNSKYYSRYGGKGITMSEEWANNFEKFIEDMGPRPSKKYSVERIDNNKGYYKDNCKWATWKEQARNRKNNKLITFKNETKCLIEWAEEIGILPGTLNDRLRNGWSIEKAFTQPCKYRITV